MKKKELVDAIAERTGATKTCVSDVLDALSDVVLKSVKEGVDVTVPNLASFKKQTRPERMGRNPATGEAMKIQAKTSVKVKAAGLMNKPL